MAADLTHLNLRRQRFIALYIAYGHERGGGLRAYGEAGYKVEGSNHPDIQLAKLLREPDIASAIAAARQELSDKFEIKQDRVLRELAFLAFSDIRHYRMNDTTGEIEVDPDEDINPAVSRAISSIEYTTVTEGDRVTRKAKIKLWDKNNALTLLMKYLGMLIDRSHNTNINASLTLDQARQLIAGANRPSVDDMRLPMQRALTSTTDDIAELQQSQQEEREIESAHRKYQRDPSMSPT